MSSQSHGTELVRSPNLGLRREWVARRTRIGLAASLLVALATWGCTAGSSTSSPAVRATLAPGSVTATSAGVSPTGSKAPGGFSATGPMGTARIADTATRLSDGRVLIVGGGTGGTDMIIDGAFATAELYDPASGEFSATGSMLTARGDHTATLLTDGRVLVTGGTSSLGGNLAQAELYDPATGKFSATGSMATARYDHTASLLADGRVLVAGGAGEVAGGVNESAELYDPKTGKFTPAGSLTAARSGATATTLSDGRILIAGGENGPGFLASAEVYDSVTGKFAATGSMQTARTAQAAALLSDGRVLIVGGWDGSKGLHHSSAEAYDPKAGSFSPAGSMAIGRAAPTATLLSDGRVLITGGFGPDDFGGPLASAELYQP